MDIDTTTPGENEPRLIDYGTPLASTASRKISLCGRNNFRGHIVHKGRTLIFESLLEREFALVALADKQVSLLEDQPPAVSFREAGGFNRKHTFDFRATLLNGQSVAVAVKPRRKAAKPEFEQLITDLSRDTPVEFADVVKSATDADLPAARVADATLILAAHSISDPVADLALQSAVKGLNGAVSIGTLRDMIRLGGRGFGAAVRAIDNGTLAIVDRFAKRPLSLGRTRADGRIDQYTLVACSFAHSKIGAN